MPLKEGILSQLYRETAQPRCQPEPAVPTETLVQLPIEALEDFPAEIHPFRPAPPARLEELKQDMISNGILSPLLVRRLDGGRYQILAGHNRKRAAQLAQYDKVPCIIKAVDDAEAVSIMLSDNLMQREDLLPSEKAWAYKMKLDAMKRQGQRTDLTCAQIEHKLPESNSADLTSRPLGTKLQENNSTDLTSSPSGTKLSGPGSTSDLTCAQIEHKLQGSDSTDLTLSPTATKLDTAAQLGQQSGESRDQVFRYIRLTHLIPELLQKVDDQAIGLQIGVTLSYLTRATQETVYIYYFVDNTNQHISQAMADELRAVDADPDREITVELLDRLTALREAGKRFRVVKVPMKDIRQYFQPDVTKEEVEQIIQDAVAFYYEHRQLR